MNVEARLKLKQLLVSHEQYNQFPFCNSNGHLTIGIGRNLDDRGVSTTEAFYLLDDDILYFSSKLAHFIGCYNFLDENRQIALIDLCFNVGVQGLLNMKEIVSALETFNYERASDEMLKSKWAEQSGERATTLANILRTGNI